MKWSRIKIIITVIVVAILAIAAVILLKQSGTEQNIPGASEEKSSRQTPAGRKIYEDTDYGFSFFYPENFSIGAFSDAENTKTILVQNAEKTAGIQIYISSFGEDITLTPQRIKKDVPDIAMSDVQTVSIGQSSPERSDLKAGTPRSDLVTAVSFKTGNAGADKSREVWFVYKSDLYQISAPQLTSPDLGDLKRSGEVLLDGIINTWKWSDIK